MTSSRSVQLSMFSCSPASSHRYPHVAGAKTSGTSADAAVTVDAHGLRALVLWSLASLGPRTADEVASALCLSVLSVRPRFSELRRLGRIEDTGERRTNASGRSAAVWRVM